MDIFNSSGERIEFPLGTNVISLDTSVDEPSVVPYLEAREYVLNALQRRTYHVPSDLTSFSNNNLNMELYLKAYATYITKAKCNTASRLMLQYLTQEFPERFVDPKLLESPLKTLRFFGFHFVGMVFDNLHSQYALASFSNLNPDVINKNILAAEFNRLDTLIMVSSIPDAISVIEKLEGGEGGWGILPLSQQELEYA